MLLAQSSGAPQDSPLPFLPPLGGAWGVVGCAGSTIAVGVAAVFTIVSLTVTLAASPA